MLPGVRWSGTTRPGGNRSNEESNYLLEVLSMFSKWKEKIVELVRWAEESLPGKTGKEKKRLVLQELNRWLGWPFPFNLVVNIVTSKLIDKAVEKLNWLVGHEHWEAIAATAEEIAPIVSVAVNNGAVEEYSTDQRLRTLYAHYGIIPTAEMVIRSSEENYFTDKEFACKCGCGEGKIKESLRTVLNRIRKKIGQPIYVSSGLRCKTRNAQVSKAKESRHITGEAADIYAEKMGPAELWQVTRGMYVAGELPELGGLGKYDGHVHVDVRETGTLVEWNG